MSSSMANVSDVTEGAFWALCRRRRQTVMRIPATTANPPTMPPTSAAMLTVLDGSAGAFGSVPFTVVWTVSRGVEKGDGDWDGGGVGDELADELVELADCAVDGARTAEDVTPDELADDDLDCADTGNDALVPFFGSSDGPAVGTESIQSHGPELQASTHPPAPSSLAPVAFMMVTMR